MRTSQQATHGYSIADAQHILKAANKHWPALQELGATEAERKRFVATIGDSIRLVSVAPSPGLALLEEARQILKDLIGSYRSAANLVAKGIDGRDAKAAVALKTKGTYPANDLELGRFVEDLGKRMKPYVARLSTRGFNKEKQVALLDAGAAFKKAFATRGKERGEAKADSLAREAVFKNLRTETSYFRSLGIEALRNQSARADFDRVTLPNKSAASAPVVAIVPPPAPAPKPATTASGS